MPIYEYKCQVCGSQEERLEGFSASVSRACPNCGEETGMRRQLSVSAVAVSGSTGSSSRTESPCAGGSCPFVRG